MYQVVTTGSLDSRIICLVNCIRVSNLIIGTLDLSCNLDISQALCKLCTLDLTDRKSRPGLPEHRLPVDLFYAIYLYSCSQGYAIPLETQSFFSTPLNKGLENQI